jgi:hypothetical protein
MVRDHKCTNEDGVKRQIRLEEIRKMEFSGSDNENDLENKVLARHYLCKLISYNCLPISSAVSKPLWDLIYHLMKSYKESKAYTSPSDFIKIPSKNEITKSIISTGTSILESNLAQFAGHFASLAADGYTKRKRKVKGFVLLFPQFGGKREVVKLVDINNTQEAFAATGAEVIEYVQSLKIDISTVNCDGYGIAFSFILITLIVYLVSQCAAFMINREANFESFLKQPQKVKTFHSRCSNHLLKQAVDDTVDHFQWIKDFESKLLKHISEINESEVHRKSMGGRGETDFQSRWYWRCDVVDFLRRRYSEYVNIFKKTAVTLSDLRCYGAVFEGVMGLHRICEKNSTSLPDLFSLHLQYFYYVHKLLGLKNIY